MDHAAAPKAAAEPDAKTKSLSFPNGVLRKHHLRPPAAPDDGGVYRECLKNHAASLGGHAIDGCGEFMLSPTADPADPSSIRCAACGCHRNFHRRLPDPHHLLHRPRDGADESDGEGEDDDEDDEDEEDDDREDAEMERHRALNRSSASPPPFYSSAPHMLLALSAGLHHGVPGPIPLRPIAAPIAAVAAAPEAAAQQQPRKRFRTKFTPEQKERMQELSERLGWRMQKRDEGLVDECCREIGVDKGVFKVWMHNNKHTFLGLPKRGVDTSGDRGGSRAAAAAAAAAAGDAVRSEEAGCNGTNNGGVENGGGNGHGHGHQAVNGSPSSSP